MYKNNVKNIYSAKSDNTFLNPISLVGTLKIQNVAI